jgi:hypothetical protein
MRVPGSFKEAGRGARHVPGGAHPSPRTVLPHFHTGPASRSRRIMARAPRLPARGRHSGRTGRTGGAIGLTIADDSFRVPSATSAGHPPASAMELLIVSNAVGTHADVFIAAERSSVPAGMQGRVIGPGEWHMDVPYWMWRGHVGQTVDVLQARAAAPARTEAAGPRPRVRVPVGRVLTRHSGSSAAPRSCSRWSPWCCRSRPPGWRPPSPGRSRPPRRCVGSSSCHGPCWATRC